MNRRNFALSWGRKLFFGFSWPLSSLLGLIYLQSFIYPQSASEMFYFAITFIGIYGLLNVVSYFILYCPFVLIFPSYYFCRIWSLFIILLLNLYILSDAYIFSQFRLHINNFIVNLLYQQGIKTFIPSNAGLIFLIVAPIIVSILYWFRGERIWRNMQKRFSNPMGNWYLVVIVLAFGISHLFRLYSSNHITQYTKLFPLSFVLNGNKSDSNSNTQGNLYYPRAEMKCTAKNSKNLLFIVIKGWRGDALSPELTPTLHHYHRHAAVYNNHFSGSADDLGGLFSLFYSLPPTYVGAVLQKHVAPVLVDELRKRKYDFVSLSQGTGAEILATFANELAPKEDIAPMADRWKSWVFDRQNTGITQPFFGMMYFAQNSPVDLARVDKEIESVLMEMFLDHSIQNTAIVITGDQGTSTLDSHTLSLDKVKTPLIVIWPSRQAKVVNHFTSHYDVTPTLMKEMFDCKNNFGQYSFGKSLNEAPHHPWHLVGVGDNFAVMDMEKSNFSQITSAGGYEVNDFSGNSIDVSQGRPDLNLKAMRETYRFYKR